MPSFLAGLLKKNHLSLSPPGYNAPYLSVYSENAIDVFDVNNMEWIQTIPLKKVGEDTALPLAPPAGRTSHLTSCPRLCSPQVRPLNVDGSLNLLGQETVRLIYFRNKMAGESSVQVQYGKCALNEQDKMRFFCFHELNRKFAVFLIKRL